MSRNSFRVPNQPSDSSRLRMVRIVRSALTIDHKNDLGGGSSSSTWSWNEDKQFENCLVEFSDDCPDRWERIAERLTTKTAQEVEQHYVLLLQDLAAIEEGLVEEPEYVDQQPEGKRKAVMRPPRKWSDEEHTSFLEGLAKYGQGDWKSVSRFMGTRTPTQVASHAQKYFQRQKRDQSSKKRNSIFDKSIA